MFAHTIFQKEAMSTRGTTVSVLKEQLEQLFPGKWLIPGVAQKRNLITGIAAIDVGVARGLARRRVTEWTGAASSGKTTVLRAAVANWCAQGLNVVYIDTSGRLVAADWAYVEDGHSGAVPSGTVPRSAKGKGKFWVVRNLFGLKQDEDAIWAAEQLIRSNIFDVVVLETVRQASLNSRVYARLQRALDRTKSSLIIIRDNSTETGSQLASWGCHTRLGFGFAEPVNCQRGLTGALTIAPIIEGIVLKDGLSQNIEVGVDSHVSNCLFTHPQVPDRRAPKARAGVEKQTAGSDR